MAQQPVARNGKDSARSPQIWVESGNRYSLGVVHSAAAPFLSGFKFFGVVSVEGGATTVSGSMSVFVLTGQNYPGKLELPQGFTQVGRNPTNELRIGDASVSAFHCEVEVTASEVTIRDLGSTNGTFINGERVSEAALKPGQFLKLGAVEFKLELAGEPEEPYIPAPPPRTFLTGNVLACGNHATLAAQFECTRCKGAYCETCVRTLRRPGGGEMVFCQNCSGRCESIPGAPPRKPSGTTFLGRLTQTMRVKRR
ncbi:MAG TPA: FHA domain-containing protein [Methylomirabilota bacterium]|nr:FHA domain-containing protein [Methylomirabilota bacterium]